MQFFLDVFSSCTNIRCLYKSKYGIKVLLECYILIDFERYILYLLKMYNIFLSQIIYTNSLSLPLPLYVCVCVYITLTPPELALQLSSNSLIKTWRCSMLFTNCLCEYWDARSVCGSKRKCMFKRVVTVYVE